MVDRRNQKAHRLQPVGFAIKWSHHLSHPTRERGLSLATNSESSNLVDASGDWT